MKKLNFADVYAKLGFRANPFTVQALRADEMGDRLMVGRDDHVQDVATRLHEAGKITCLDGHVGVGKTSLVNVATFQCFQAFLSGETPQLLIPLNDAFQLSKDEDIEKFCSRVFLKVANGLLAQREHLSNYNLSGPSLTNLNAWLNNPVVQHINASGGGSVSLSVPGFSAGAKGGIAASSQVNTSTGFTQEGLEQLVRTWLDEIFTDQGNGGVVCVIDNLELLESGINARRMLEALRDRLFNINGLRWVFCGANGVIHSLAASNRLGAFLNEPIIDVQNITPGTIGSLVMARLQEYSMENDPAAAENNLPISLKDIESLYVILNFNLRDLLAQLDQYCKHHLSLNKSFDTAEAKSRAFDKWLHKVTAESYHTLSSRLPQDAWSVLDIAMSDMFKGTFGKGDYSAFNSNSTVKITDRSLEKWLGDLVKLNLLSKNIDDSEGDTDGFKRDVFSVTAKGAFVTYARLVKRESHCLIPTSWLRRVHN
jgi:hypothetical protein